MDQLKARLDEVVRKQLYNGKPLSELHQIVRAANQLPDNTLPPEYTAGRLRSASVFELKYLVRKFGLAAVNGRLAGN